MHLQLVAIGNSVSQCVEHTQSYVGFTDTIKSMAQESMAEMEPGTLIVQPTNCNLTPDANMDIDIKLDSKEITSAVSTVSAVVGGLSIAGNYITSAVGRNLTKLRYTTCGKYPCCGRDLNSQGCFAYYKCCKQDIHSNSDGCYEIPINERKYKCCNSDINDKGCQLKYKCCGKQDTSEGCISVCDICNKDINIIEFNCGFEMQCCELKGLIRDKNDEKDGCRLKCQQCNKPWGIPIKWNAEYWIHEKGIKFVHQDQGCNRESKHDMHKIDIKS